MSRRPIDVTEAQARQAAFFLVGSIIATVLLYYVIPYGRNIGHPLILLSTLAHEMGHGIAAVLVGRDFVQFEMFWNGSGVATHAGDPDADLALAFVSAGGLVGPAIVAAVGFAVGRTTKGARNALFFFGGGLILADLIVVRNLFGFVFVAVVAAICLLIAAKGKAWASQLTLLFIASQLALSVFSRSDYLFTEEVNGIAGMRSDVAKMADHLFLPYWFWGAVCGLFSVLVLLVGLRAFFGPEKQQ